MVDFKRTRCPTRSPWGTVDGARELAPGIWDVSTSGHGGIKLSAQRNRLVPDYMRSKGGWYEEDCDWAIVAIVFPDPFQEFKAWQKAGTKTHYQYAIESMLRWHKDQIEQFADKLEPIRHPIDVPAGVMALFQRRTASPTGQEPVHGPSADPR